MTTGTSTYEGTTIERWIASDPGRAARVALGVGLISAALAFIARPAGFAVAAIGLVPIVTGAFNICPVAPFWGGHLQGSRYCRPKAASTPRSRGT